MSTDVDELTRDPAATVERWVPGGLLIAGEWVDATPGGTVLVVVDPATGQHLTSVREASASDVDAAVQAAATAFRTWRRTSAEDRAGVLERLAGLIERDAEKIATIETLDNGKPLNVARHHDVANAVATLRYFAGLARTSVPESVEPVFARRGRPEVLVDHVPLGVVAAVIPWNAPFMTAVWKLAPALAFGNTIVLKPAEDTPLGTLLLGALCVEAGLPPGVVNVLPGGGATTGAALVGHPGVAKISFTGSTSVGREIARNAAADVKRVGLELGGKSATIVLADAVRENLDRAVSVALWAVFANSGQVCSAGSRLLVEDTVSDEFLDALQGAAEKIRVGGGLDPATQLGPLISQRQRERVHAFVTDPGTPAPVVGGQQPDGAGWFYPPTVVLDPGRDARIWREEVFGPVLCATSFGDEQEAIELANDTEYGLAAGVITHDRARAARIAEGLDVGTVWVNAHNVYDPAVPWGGRKQSGLGREIGYTARHAYTEEKAVWFTNF